MSKINEAKAALQKAMDLLDAVAGEEDGEEKSSSAAPEGDDDEFAGKSLQMKLGKYKQ